MLFKKHKDKGFTIIELIVVIAIIAILAAIILTNVSKYIARAKVTRANTDAENIVKALTLFYSQYGEYPSSYTSCPAPGCMREFYPTIMGAPVEPFLEVNGTDHPFSEVYKLDFNGFNADYFVENGFYYTYLFDADGDGKMGCGVIDLFDQLWNVYGQKMILCQDCPCGTDPYITIPYQITPTYNTI